MPLGLALKEMICSALMNPCSYRLLDGTELGTVSGQEDLGKVWQQLTDGRLTLCCQVRGQRQCLCWAGLQSRLCFATSMLAFSCRTQTHTWADLFSTRCWLSTLTWHRDQGTWSSAREMCWISSLKVALSPAAGPGLWSLLWGGTGENVASPVLSQVHTLRSYRLALGFAQS